MNVEAAPLAGLKVLELSHGVAAAYCGRQFAQWGADVVVVERAAGSPVRQLAPLARDAAGAPHSLLWQYVAANKRCMRREALASTDGPDGWHRLLECADFVIVDDDAHGLAELGASWAQLRERHPQLCVVALSSFGLSGPYVEHRGPALVVEALSGYLALNGLPGRPPLRAPGHLLEYVVGVSAFIGALAAYLKRQRTGRGDFVEVSALETIASVVPFLRVQYLQLDKTREGGCEPGVRLLPCADGYVSLTVPVEPASRELYRDVLGIPVDAWPQKLTGRHLQRVQQVRAFMSEYTRAKTADEIFHGFERRGVTCGKLITPGGLLQNEQLLAREYFRTCRHPQLGELAFAGPAGKLRSSTLPVLQPAPQLDAALQPHALSWQRTAVAAPTADPAARELPLQGTRVVDLTQAWIGPFATLMLADLGAEVIKVESHKRPDVWRQPSPLPVAIQNILAERVNRSHYFNSVNRNKRSLTLDLSSAQGRELLLRLLRDADVIAENYSPKVMERWGMGHASLAELAPQLVMLSSSGFGKTGPWSQYRSNGAAIEALAGWDALHAYPDEEPFLMGFYQADAISGFQLGALALLCLVRRARSGRGEAVDAAMLEAASGYIGELIMHAQLGGEVSACGNRSPDMAPHGVFPAHGEDRWIAIAIPDDATWQALLRVPGIPASLAAAEFASLEQRLLRQDALEAQLANFTREREADALMAQLQAAGVPAGVVRGALEAVDEPHLAARGWFVSMTHPDVGTHKYNGFPWRFADCELLAHTPPPRLGEHARGLLGELLGLDAEQIATLEELGITGAVL